MRTLDSESTREACFEEAQAARPLARAMIHSRVAKFTLRELERMQQVC